MKFDFQNPTRLIFGAGVVSQVGEIAKSYGKKALIVSGGGSVKRNGTFEKVSSLLKKAGVDYAECSGVEPNPKIEDVRRGAKIAHEENCDMVIALGGGSTMDSSKAIAAAFYYDKDPWDMIYHGQPSPYYPVRALPIITVPTLAATGSEMNNSAVFSNKATNEKSFLQAECIFPKVALADPELTVTVPKNQTSYGVCDIITHVTEAYFNTVGYTPIQDQFAEAVISNTMQWGLKAIENGNDLEVRGQVQYASILALNGWVQQAQQIYGYPVHMIEHTISGYHDVTHAAGLSAINPSWMRFAASSHPEKFVRFAEQIFGMKAKTANDMDVVMQGIEKFESFLKTINCPTSLSELNIDGSLITEYAQKTLSIINDGNGNLPAYPPMSEDDIIKMLKAAL